MKLWVFGSPGYRILKEGVDFVELPDAVDRGTRTKKYVKMKKDGRKAIFKYEGGKKFRGSEDCSEKIACEIAKVLGHKTAEIDLAEGENGERGLLSYLFVDRDKDEIHEDMEDYLKITKENEKDAYTIKRVEEFLTANFPQVDFADFVRILIFDALVGERDRHAGNWGITTIDGKQSISPIYDTASCLVRDFRSDAYMQKFIDGRKDFIADFVDENKPAIYMDGGQEYKPMMRIIDYLLENYPDVALPEIRKLDRLSDDKIDEVVWKVPVKRMGDRQKEFIVRYLILQRDKIKEKGVEYEKK